MCQGRVLSKPVQPVPKARITSGHPSCPRRGRIHAGLNGDRVRQQIRTGQAACLFAPFETLVQFNKRFKTFMSHSNEEPRRFSAPFLAKSARPEFMQIPALPICLLFQAA